MTPLDLYRWRQSLSLTQKQAAETLGIPIGTYQNWEQGIRAVPALAVRCCELVSREASSNRATLKPPAR